VSGLAWGLGIALGLYVAAILALVALGRRADARALAGLVPDCVVLVRRLLRDPRVRRRTKVALALLVAYLVMPIDLVPDFIPIAGQLDDAILVALVLRSFLRAGGGALVQEHWPGPERTLRLVTTASARG
jgi:uncharacterized membrane protein YkvA (DUF1232 family)